MKKQLLILSVLATLGTPALLAENVVFLDAANGNQEIADGATITRNQIINNEPIPGLIIDQRINGDILVKNISGQEQTIALACDIKGIPFGSLSVCLPVCINVPNGESGNAYPVSYAYTHQNAQLTAQEEKDVQTEWVVGTMENPYKDTQGAFDVTYQITYPATGAKGPKVTIHYVAGDAGVDAVAADNGRVEVARYDLLGNKVQEPVPGVNIIRYSDGSIAKVIVK